jgi:3-hydroxy-3-methylglutaryl CoA synthase
LLAQVRQEELERHDGVPSGKYTVGLGQQGVAFVGDREDPVSMGLTVMRRLLERHNVSPLEVRPSCHSGSSQSCGWETGCMAGAM